MKEVKLIKMQPSDKQQNGNDLIADVMPSLDFGDYAIIEQKRYGCENDMFLHKVIGRSVSNSFVDVPVQSPPKETLHSEMVEVISCICCGVQETEVRKYKATDIKPNTIYRT